MRFVLLPATRTCCVSPRGRRFRLSTLPRGMTEVMDAGWHAARRILSGTQGSISSKGDPMFKVVGDEAGDLVASRHG